MFGCKSVGNLRKWHRVVTAPLIVGLSYFGSGMPVLTALRDYLVRKHKISRYRHYWSQRRFWILWWTCPFVILGENEFWFVWFLSTFWKIPGPNFCIRPRSCATCHLHIIHRYTGYAQKDGAVSKVNKKFISHLTRAQRTPSAAATVQVSHALPAVRFSCLLRGRGASFQDGFAAGKGFLCAPLWGVQICDYSAWEANFW